MQALHFPNVHLVRSPILSVGARAVRTADGEYAADAVVLATGFDPVAPRFWALSKANL